MGIHSDFRFGNVDHLYFSARNWQFGFGVRHDTFDADVRLPNVAHERIAIVIPELSKITCRRELDAAQLKSKLKAVRSHVIEVLHT